MKPLVLPVIHYENDEQAMRNAETAFDAGCAGVFLIHMDCANHLLPAIAKRIKAQWPEKLVGINYLGGDPAEAVASNISLGLDMTWTDNQLTHSGAGNAKAEKARAAMADEPAHMLFAGVAFKHQKYEPQPGVAVQKAIEFGFIPTTSGEATGVAAEQGKIEQMRAALGPEAPLAIASGITPDNVHEYAPYLSHILVATGVSSSFYEFDYEKLYQLRVLCDRAA